MPLFDIYTKLSSASLPRPFRCTGEADYTVRGTRVEMVQEKTIWSGKDQLTQGESVPLTRYYSAKRDLATKLQTVRLMKERTRTPSEGV